MADEGTTGAASGAAQGAAAGAAFGPWGAVIGAVIGGAIGLLGGNQRKRARQFAQRAAATRRKQQQLQLAVQRRDLVRQMRIAQSATVAAGASEGNITSSAVLGAQSSLAAQGKSAITYLDTQVGLDNLYQTYAKKSGKASQAAQAYDTLLGAGASLAKTAGDLYGLSQSPQSTTTNTNTFTSFNSTAAVTNMQNNPAFTTFGSTLNLGKS